MSNKILIGTIRYLASIEHLVKFLVSSVVTQRTIRCKKPSSAILRRVLVRTDVSEERIASIIRAGESR
jgi:hypothetical protein